MNWSNESSFTDFAHLGWKVGNGLRRLARLITLSFSISLLVIPLQTAWSQAPDWTVSPSAYEASMNVIGALWQGHERINDSDALVAAFVGNEVRGVAKPTNVAGELLFFLTIYGNDEGEVLNFKVFVPAEDDERLIKETIFFMGDGLHGSIGVPFTWNTISPSSVPDWSVDPAAFQSSMNMIGALYVDGFRSNHPYDLVAAVVDDEVRGIASPIQVAGKMLFFLTIYGNVGGEVVTFKAYDTAGDQVYAIDGELWFEADTRHGSIGQPHILNTRNDSQRPDWRVDATAFEHSMNLVAALYVEGVRATNHSDLIAAFVGNEVRGVASPTEVAGYPLFFLTIFGDTSNLTITFQCYDAARDQVLSICETLWFEQDALLGSAAEPIALNSRSENARPEWQVNPTAYEYTMSIIGTISPDVVPSPHPDDLVAAMVDNTVRGIASPMVVSGQSLYFLTVYGNIDNETISFFVYDTSSDQVKAISSAVPFQDDAVYGSTDRPLLWKVDMTPIGSNVVVIPEDAVTGSTSVTITFNEVVEEGFTTLIVKDSGPTIPSQFQFTSLSPEYYDVTTTAVFTEAAIVSIRYSEKQLSEIDETELRLLHIEDGEFVDITTEINVEEKIITGETNSLSFFVVVAPSSLATSVAPIVQGKYTSFSLSPNFPNPFNPSTTIRYSLPLDSEVKLAIYDVMGREVKTLVKGVKTTGNWVVVWDGTDNQENPVSSGIYLYMLQAGEITQLKKMTLLR